MFCSEGSKTYRHTFIYMGVDLEMQSVLDITKTEVRKTRGKTNLPPRRRRRHARCKWSGPPATVGLIASLLSHPAGLACNETEAFGWNDLSHPPSSHLPMLLSEKTGEMTTRKTKALGKLLLNCTGNFNQCGITPPIPIKGNQLKAEASIPAVMSESRHVFGM